ncbi:MAG TPA: DNA primase [Gaiellaceae bacterium]
MARIADTTVNEVKAAADMVELVSARTALRKVGGRYTGRCPFHEERTPSFSVNAVDKLYYCFGCGARGDVITFVRETEQLDFNEAVEWLADRFNVKIEHEESSPAAERERERRSRLLELLELATTYYERYLWETKAGASVREYLASRKLGVEVCKEFRLGLSPGGSGLVPKARQKGFTTEEIAAAGLANRRGKDYFTFRLMFPLADARGRVLGYSARKLRDDDPLRGKYVNSPEGALFHKSNILYGLHLARRAIAKQERAVVVEGNTDVIAVRQSGLEPVVASMGTALTERQLKELGRLCRRLYLCFDADAAGQEATLRGMELATAQGFDVRVVTLPPGLDPADAADGFEQRLDEAESYLAYRVRIEIERAPDRQEAFVRVRELLARFEDSPERQRALRFLSDKLDLPKEVQSGLAPRVAGRGSGKTAGSGISPHLLEAGARRERDALAGVVAHPDLKGLLRELTPEHFDDELHRRVREYLIETPQTADDDVVGLVAELDARASAAAIDKQTAEQLLLRLRERGLQRELASADGAHLPELQRQLARVRAAIHDFA